MKYLKAKVDIIAFDTEDIITTSVDESDIELFSLEEIEEMLEDQQKKKNV